MRAVIAFFVDRPLLVNLITVAVCGAGLIGARNMTRTMFPAFASQEIEVSASLPGSSAVDMERLVTFRLEEALQGLEGLRESSSQTTNGHCDITLKFKSSHRRMSESVEQVRGRVAGIGRRLPADLLPIQIHERRVTHITLMELLVEKIDLTDPVHRRQVERIRDRLRRVPQIVDVSSTLPDLELHVTFARRQLAALGVSVASARERVLEYLRYAPLGEARVVDTDVAVELEKPFEGIADLERLPLVMNRSGRGVRLSDVATVALRPHESTQRLTLQGSDFVELGLDVDVGADAIDMAAKVREVIGELNAELPAPLHIRVGEDAAEIIDHELSILETNGLGGVAIVVVVLVLFLGWRVSVMTALGIPFCYLGTVVILQMLGINFNLISLVAMILVIGILVDDAIIVSEEFTTRLATAPCARAAAIDAVMGVGKPVLGMVATTVLAVAPLLLVKGDASVLLQPLPVVIISTLGLSTFESFFLLPNHLQHFMPASAKPVRRRLVGWLREHYQGMLRWVLRWRYFVALAVVALMIGAGVILMRFMEVNISSLTIGERMRILVELPSSSSLAQTEAAVRPVEAIVAQLPADLVDYYQTHLGSAEVGDNNYQGFKYAQVDIVPAGTMADWEQVSARIEDTLGDRLASLSGFTKLYVIKEEQEAERRDVVTIYVSGGDRIPFHDLQQTIRGAIKPVAGVKDIFIDESRLQRSLRFTPNHAALLAYDLDETALLSQLREHFSKQELLRVRLDGREVDLFSDFSDDPAATPEALAHLAVMTSRGISVPLRYLGAWNEAEVLRVIEHTDMLRSFKVDVLYARDDHDAEAITDAIEESLAPVREAYPGYHISVKEGEKESQARAWLLQIALTCIGLIYVALALSLGSLIQPVVVIFAIPFGFVGVVLALAAHGMDMGVMAAVGIIGLAGVVVNDSLVMTSTINDETRKAGRALREAVVVGAGARFQAVVITSVTTLGGVLPLAYGLGGRAGWIQPMVFALGWGLLFATLLSLLFIPCVLLILDDARRAARRVGGWMLRRPRAPAA